MIGIKSIFKYIFYLLLSLLITLLVLLSFKLIKPVEKIKINRALSGEVNTLTIDGQEFRDLNKNGQLDIYEDHRNLPRDRANDLLRKMTLEEKVGQMFHPPFILKPDLLMFLYEIAIRGNSSTESQIIFDHITHFNLYGNPSPAELAKKINSLQKTASRSRLGIPITISSDPIHEVPKGGGVASFSVDGFSKWPSQLGFAATSNPKIIREFAEIVLNPHLFSGRNQIYPGGNFEYHLLPFKEAIKNNLKVVMPYYGIPVGQTDEDVAMAFNSYILKDLLREELNYDGVICSDWGIITGRHWGVDELSIEQRYEKSIKAGIDQYGGEKDTDYLIDLVKNDQITEVRIDESVRRILLNKFELGLFDNPYVNEELVQYKVNTQDNIEAGLEAQRKSIVLLENNGILPLKKGSKIFVDGLSEEEAREFGELVKDPDDADAVIMYIHTVFNGNQESGLNRAFDNFLSTLFPNGDLNFNKEINKKIEAYSNEKKLIVVVDLNRPAILKSIKESSSGLIGTFGVQDRIIFEGLFGEFNPSGKLPFEIPSSMESVLNQKEDLPDDSANPTYEFGYGISY